MESILDVLFSLSGLLIVVMLLGLGYFVGAGRERRHFAELEDRDARHRDFPVYDIDFVPLHVTPKGAELVMGQVVIASDYFKTWLASWRSIFGGEMKSFVNMTERGKAEARLRMIEEARKKGAVAIVNVRFETSEIGGNVQANQGRAMSEVLCYGTAVFE